MGLEPSAALRSLHQRVLQHDAELAGPPEEPPNTLRHGRNGQARRGADGSTFRRPGAAVPAAVEELVGRESELDVVNRLLSAGRLVSLIGPGGSGKTTVAFAAARAVQAAYPDGAWVAHLAAVRDADEVPLAVADALGVPLDGSAPGGDPSDRVVAYLSRRQALLVLDNCEHVLRSRRHASPTTSWPAVPRCACW